MQWNNILVLFSFMKNAKQGALRHPLILSPFSEVNFRVWMLDVSFIQINDTVLFQVT